jgi:hypothetical protein
MKNPIAWRKDIQVVPLAMPVLLTCVALNHWRNQWHPKDAGDRSRRLSLAANPHATRW